MFSNNYTIRMPDELREKLEVIAKNDGRKLSNLIIKILTDYVSSHSVNKEG